MPGTYGYKNWYDACMESRYRKAVANIDIEHKGKRVAAQVVKPLNGDGWIVYKDTGIRIRQASPKEIDSRTKWDDF